MIIPIENTIKLYGKIGINKLKNFDINKHKKKLQRSQKFLFYIILLSKKLNLLIPYGITFNI